MAIGQFLDAVFTQLIPISRLRAVAGIVGRLVIRARLSRTIWYGAKEMVRFASFSAFVYGALWAVNAFAADPTWLASDSINSPAAASWRPTGDLPNLSIAAFQQGTSAMAADSQVADIVATNRNRLFGSQGQYAAKPLSSELAALVHPLGDPREDRRFTSPSQLAPPLATSPTMNRPAASFVVPSPVDASDSAQRLGFAGIGQGFPSLGSLRH